ncbi:hypothetical protein DPMN_178922 [Dreissena polymorpha]|uniref:Uncharacterized protein n=1 Tax=Dreissena polymorpha TaxID=45954 RepID=A0A9D4EDN9_DREPO|nr:hypothetical protein DPMN_178922 [Dreissena polymorpha]
MLICKDVRKPESSGQVLYETTVVSPINNGDYESLGNRYDIRRNESDINSTDNANALRTNMYDSLAPRMCTTSKDVSRGQIKHVCVRPLLYI